MIPVGYIENLPLDKELLQNEAQVEPTTSVSQLPTPQDIVTDMDEDDTMIVQGKIIISIFLV